MLHVNNNEQWIFDSNSCFVVFYAHNTSCVNNFWFKLKIDDLVLFLDSIMLKLEWPWYNREQTLGSV